MAKNSTSADTKPTESADTSKTDGKPDAGDGKGPTDGTTSSTSSGPGTGATRKDGHRKDEADKADPAKEQPKKADKPKPPYAVAQGKSVTTKRGLLGPGEEVTARDFPGGVERLRELAEAGVVVKS